MKLISGLLFTTLLLFPFAKAGQKSSKLKHRSSESRSINANGQYTNQPIIPPKPKEKKPTIRENVRIEYEYNPGHERSTLSLYALMGFTPNTPISDIYENILEPPNFVVDKLIAEGSYGRVFRARNMKTDQIVALKIVGPLRYIDGVVPEFEFMPLLQSIPKHVHIVQHLNSYRFGCRYVLELQLFKENLRSANQRAKMRGWGWSTKDLQKLAFQVTEALCELHKLDIVHGNVKMENILLDDDRNFHLGDFGLATKLPRLSDDKSETTDVITPEFVKKNSVSAKDDMWALGVVIFKLIAEMFSRTFHYRLKRYEIFTPIPKIERFRENFAFSTEKLAEIITHDKSRLDEIFKVMDVYYDNELELFTMIKDFLRKCIETDLKKRMSAEQAMKHPLILDYLRKRNEN